MLILCGIQWPVSGHDAESSRFLPGTKRITYLQFLRVFDKFDGFSKVQKTNEQYFQYLNGLLDYREPFLGGLGRCQIRRES